MQKILIVEDDLAIQALLHDFIQEAGYSVELASDGVEALSRFSEQNFDLVLLDIMLPKIDGYGVCEVIRQKSNVPIIMLTALDGEESQIKGLDLQADDYITKPFSLMVLRARIEKVLKKQTSSTEYQDENYHFYFERMEFFFNDTPVELSKTEQKLLKILVFNRNQVVTREILIDRIWSNEAEFVDENALSVTVNRLRKKLDAGNRIQTVYGIGYTWRNE